MYLQSIKPVIKHNAAKSVNRSILKKSRHIGFGVFIVHSSMPPALVPLCIPHNIVHTSQPLYGGRAMRDGEKGWGGWGWGGGGRRGCWFFVQAVEG